MSQSDREHGEVVGYGSLEQHLADIEAQLFVALGALKPFAGAYVAALEDGAAAMDHGCDHESNHDDATWPVRMGDLRMARAATIYKQSITKSGIQREWMMERNEAFLLNLEQEKVLVAITHQKNALAAALSALHFAVAKYIDWNGPSCDTHEGDFEPTCQTCQMDRRLNLAFGEAMGCEKALARRDAEIKRTLLLNLAAKAKPLAIQPHREPFLLASELEAMAAEIVP